MLARKHEEKGAFFSSGPHKGPHSGDTAQGPIHFDLEVTSLEGGATSRHTEFSWAFYLARWMWSLFIFSQSARFKKQGVGIPRTFPSPLPGPVPELRSHSEQNLAALCELKRA